MSAFSSCVGRSSFLDREVEAQLKQAASADERDRRQGFLDREVEAQLKRGTTRARNPEPGRGFLDREVEAQLKHGAHEVLRLQVAEFPRPRGRGPN